MTHRSITLRLSVFFALISSLILIGIAWYLYVSLVEHFRQRDVSELTGKVALVRHLLSELTNEAAIPGDVHRFRDTMVGHDTLHLWLFSKDAGVIFGTSDFDIPPSVIPPAAPPETSPSMVRDWFPGPARHLRVMAAWAQVGSQPAQQVRLVLVADASAHLSLLTRYRRTLLAASACALIASALLGAWVTRRELRPVAAIAKAASTVSASRLNDRLDVGEVPDEVRPLVEAFNAMLARLDDSFTRLSSFSSDLAHELRTPVSNLVMHTQVTLSKARSAEQYRQALESNLEEFDRLTRMISDMLFLAKADHGESALKLESLDLRREVQAVIEFFRPLAEERKVSLDIVGDARVTVDRLMVQRAIANLVSNAVRHTDQNGTVKIQIEPAASGGAELSVSNPGPDIAPEHLPRLFDRFYRVQFARENSAESSGLGLAIVKSIMFLHGGAVSAQSGKGVTTFTLSFVR